MNANIHREKNLMQYQMLYVVLKNRISNFEYPYYDVFHTCIGI